jgi:large subunit ribosomal protein L6
MKKKLSQKLQIPDGIECTYKEDVLSCKKGQLELSHKIHAPSINLILSNKEIIIECLNGNKKDYKKIATFEAHIKNIFRGLTENFTYELEICNVHFPMSVKSEKENIIINNFLGEKVPRHAKILPNVEVKIQGNKITVTSHNKDAAGQTAANFEQATKVGNRDRRIYQDGIFITHKPKREFS